MVAAAAIYFGSTWRTPRPDTVLVAAGFVAPWLANLLYVSKLSPFAYLDLTPFALVITGLCFSVAFVGQGSVLSVIKVEASDVLDHIGDPIFVFDGASQLVTSNRACKTFLASLGRRSIEDMIWRLGQLSKKLALVEGEAGSMRDITFDLDQAARIFNARAATTRLGRSAEQGTVLVLRDVTEHRATEAEALIQKRRLRQIIDLIPHPIFAQNQSGQIQLANLAYANLYATSVDQIEGTDLCEFHCDADKVGQMLSHDRRVIDSGSPVTMQYVFREGPGQRIFETTKIPFSQGDSREPAIAGVSIDVTEERDRKQRLEQLAATDPLTSLANRRHFRKSLESALRSARRANRQIGLLFLDLHRFKVINDLHGHSVGDRVLRRVARRLVEGLEHDALQRSPDSGEGAPTVSRLGGDEFIVLLPHIDGPREAADAGRRIIERLAKPMTVASQVLDVGARMGIAMYPTDGEDPETLIRHCDQALTKAKQGAVGTIEFFSSAIGVAEERRLSVELALRSSLLNDELSLEYQPIWDCSGVLAGAEALVRWSNFELGNIRPSEFIPVAEQSGLMAPLGERILQMLCEQINSWRDRYDLPRFSTNLSAKQVLDTATPDLIASTLERFGLTGNCLEFELTESSILSRNDQAETTLPKLRQLGATLALDDFGTGYSSLSHLRHFRFERIKIDQSFVAGIGQSADDEELTRAVIALAHRLNMEVVAEGVETESQYEFLRGQGCDFVQGWLLGRPMPAEEFEGLLREQVMEQGRERVSA